MESGGRKPGNETGVTRWIHGGVSGECIRSGNSPMQRASANTTIEITRFGSIFDLWGDCRVLYDPSRISY